MIVIMIITNHQLCCGDSYDWRYGQQRRQVQRQISRPPSSSSVWKGWQKRRRRTWPSAWYRHNSAMPTPAPQVSSTWRCWVSWRERRLGWHHRIFAIPRSAIGWCCRCPNDRPQSGCGPYDCSSRPASSWNRASRCRGRTGVPGSALPMTSPTPGTSRCRLEYTSRSLLWGIWNPRRPLSFPAVESIRRENKPKETEDTVNFCDWLNDYFLVAVYNVTRS